jgi:hypothetical protein
MNKIVFQIGILGFCVSAVVFGGSGGSVLDIVSRSFIVFVGIVIAAAVTLFVAGSMLHNSMERKAMENKMDPAKTQTTQQQEQKS